MTETISAGEYPARKRLYYERLVDGMSPANRPDAIRFLKQKDVEGCKPNTLQNYAITVSKLDRFLSGHRIVGTAPDRFTDYLLSMKGTNAEQHIFYEAARIRHYLRILMDVDQLPRELRKALNRRRTWKGTNRKPVSSGEFHALLEATQDFAASPTHRLKLQAMLWTLWDSGFRIGELLSLDVNHVELDGKGGARLRLNEKKPGLKTGARTIYVVDCVPSLTAWIAAHPLGTDASAPLFPGHGRRPKAYHPCNAAVVLRRLSNTAGTRPIHPHLFRHSRATRAAQARWNEAEMRACFGWSDDSPMPALYTHLALADMEQQVRRDAGIDQNGARLKPQSSPDKNVKDALLDLLGEALSERMSKKAHDPPQEGPSDETSNPSQFNTTKRENQWCAPS